MSNSTNTYLNLNVVRTIIFLNTTLGQTYVPVSSYMNYCKTNLLR